MILNHVFDIRAVFLWWEYGPRQAPFFPIKVIFLSCEFWHAYELGGHIFSNNILYLNYLACVFRKRWPPSLHADHNLYVREGIIPNASYTHADWLPCSTCKFTLTHVGCNLHHKKRGLMYNGTYWRNITDFYNLTSVDKY